MRSPARLDRDGPSSARGWHAAEIACAAVLTAVLAAMGSVVAAAQPAGAEDRTAAGIAPQWGFPSSYEVSFVILGDNCTVEEKAPSGTIGDLRKLETGAGHWMQLFLARTTGFATSCASESSNVQYKVTVTLPSGTKLWTNINVTGKDRSFRVDCYGNDANLRCEGSNSTENPFPQIFFGPKGPNTRFTACAAEGETCSVNDGSAKTVAYGANGQWRYFNPASSATSIPCDNSTWGDPAPNVVKSCWVKYR